MRVRVKLFAALSRFSKGGLPGSPFELDLPDDSTLQDVVDCLQIPPEEARVAFVNGIVRELDYVLKPGDEVGIFPPIGGGSMPEICVDTWLYGELARYGGEFDQGSFANLQVRLPSGAAVKDLLRCLSLPTEARGITFINGELSAMPGLQPDLDHPLQDGDRVAFFHLRSMWPFQYRHGVPMVSEMSTALSSSEEGALHHSYEDGPG